jgi:hypothetical protein
MSFATKAEALASLREFSPALRAAHQIVRFYSETHGAFRFSRVLMARRGRA